MIPGLAAVIGDAAWQELRDQAELLGGAGNEFDPERFARGEVTPVFFGSALNNFGVEPFLEALLKLAPPPDARADGIDPLSDVFSGFVFKIQANMDMKHRDRIAFVRVCSGRFERDMVVNHARLGKKVRLGRAYKLFARERQPIDEAFPGDVIGVVNPGTFALGDMLTTGGGLPSVEIPRFPSEHFAALVNTDIARYKQFQRGLSQLEEEGAVQIFNDPSGLRREPILGVVGELQFDVVLSRLHDEYGVDARIERAPYECARWVESDKARTVCHSCAACSPASTGTRSRCTCSRRSGSWTTSRARTPTWCWRRSSRRARLFSLRDIRAVVKQPAALEHSAAGCFTTATDGDRHWGG